MAEAAHLNVDLAVLQARGVTSLRTDKRTKESKITAGYAQMAPGSSKNSKTQVCSEAQAKSRQAHPK